MRNLALKTVKLWKRLPRLEIRRIPYGTFVGKWVTTQPRNRFIYIFAGNGSSSIRAGGKCFRMVPGQWFFIPAGMESSHEQNEDLDLISIHFSAELFPGVEFFSGQDVAYTGNTPEWSDVLRRLCGDGAGMGEALCLPQILWQVIGTALAGKEDIFDREYRRFSGFVPLLELFSQNIYRNFSVDEMAGFMKMGKESFVKHFSAETGTSPKAFFNELRAAAMARELLDRHYSIQEIAGKFGFTDIFYFSRFFKRYMKLSPREYRNRNSL